MWKYFTAKGSSRWLDVLPGLVQSYNNTVHSSIRFKPNEVNSSNSQEVFRNTYGFNSFRDYLKSQVKTIKLKPEDKIRLRYARGPLDKGYYPNWSDVVHTVEQTNKGSVKPYIKVAGISKILSRRGTENNW